MYNKFSNFEFCVWWIDVFFFFFVLLGLEFVFIWFPKISKTIILISKTCILYWFPRLIFYFYLVPVLSWPTINLGKLVNMLRKIKREWNIPCRQQDGDIFNMIENDDKPLTMTQGQQSSSMYALCDKSSFPWFNSTQCPISLI